MATKVSIFFTSNVTNALAGIGKVIAATKKLNGYTYKMGDRLTNFGEKMVAGVTLPIAAGLGFAAKEAVGFEKSIINASRALDFSTKQTQDFSKAARTIAPSLGILPKEFADLATESGKLGVAAKDILGYSRNIAELAAATDTNGVKLAEMMAGIRTVFKLSNDEVRKFGAVVNFLDDAIGGTAAKILNFTNRVSGNAKLLGFAAGDVAALGSVLLKLNLNASKAATGINNLLLNLSSVEVLTKRQRKGLDMLGLSASEIATAIKANPTEGLLKFLKAVNDLQSQGGDVLGALGLFMGRQHAPKIARLAQNYTDLARALAIARNEQAALDKLQAETQKRLNSSAGQIAVFKAQLSNLSITIGTALLPPLNQTLQYLTPLVQKFAMFAENNPKLLEKALIIAGITAAIAPLLIAIGAVIKSISIVTSTVIGVASAFKWLFGVALPGLGGISGIFSAVIGGLKIIGGGLFAVIASKAVIVNAAIWGVIAVAYAFYQNWDWITRQSARLWEWLVNVIHSGFRSLANTQFGQWAIRNWMAMARAIVAGATWINDTIRWLIKGFFAIPENLNSLKNTVFTNLHNFFFKTIPNLFNQAGTWFYTAGANLMITFANGIKARVNEALKPIIEFTNRVRAYLPSSDAKVGALSDLTRAGKALFDTVAQGFNDRRLVQVVSQGSQNTRDAIAFPSPVAASGGNTITINFSPNIQLANGGDARNVIDQLRPYARELLELIERSQNRINRGSF